MEDTVLPIISGESGHSLSIYFFFNVIGITIVIILILTECLLCVSHWDSVLHALADLTLTAALWTRYPLFLHEKSSFGEFVICSHSKWWSHDLNPLYRIFFQDTNLSKLFPIYSSLMTSYCVWKRKYKLSVTLKGPSKSLSNLLFHSHLSLIPHPLTCVLCFTLTKLCISQIYNTISPISQPLFLSLQCFPFASWQTSVHPSRPSSNSLYCMQRIPDLPGQS